MGRTYRDEEFIKRVGNNVRGVLSKKGITHMQFNINSGLLVSRIVSGDLNMTISTLKRIADCLQVDINELTK